MPTLYFKTTCQYCRKVLDFAVENNIELELKDIHSDPAIVEELVTLGGKRQVPYLVDREKGVEMYESSEIINYLKDNYAN